MSVYLKTVFTEFASVAAPVLDIKDDVHYEAARELAGELKAEANRNTHDILNPVIDVLLKAIARYENRDSESVTIVKEARQVPADIAMLSVLMEQYDLGVADFPEIGDKSLVSRILSGQRNMTKKHIVKLSKRFGIEPGLFFD